MWIFDWPDSDRPVGAAQAQAPWLPADRSVITVKLEQPGFVGFDPFGVTPAGSPDLRATLKTRRGTVARLEIDFTGTGASSSAHFFFPRTLDGAAVLGPGWLGRRRPPVRIRAPRPLSIYGASWFVVSIAAESKLFQWPLPKSELEQRRQFPCLLEW
jgi:hypothetical protein